MNKVDSTTPELPEDAFLAPMSSAQRGIWLTQQMEPESLAYLVSSVYEIRGPLDLAALSQAIDALHARHEPFRTGLIQLDGELHQVVHIYVDADFAVGDVDEGAEPDAARRAFIDTEIARPFVLSRPPLLRVRVLRLAQDHHVLVLVAHHCITDGQSFEMLWHELASSYAHAVAAAPLAPAEPQFQFADYANWEQQWRGSTEHAEQLSYFQEQLRDVRDAIDLPFLDRRVPAWRGISASLDLPAVKAEQLLALGQRAGATPFMVMLTIFAGVLYRWSGQETIVIGTPVSLRDEPGLENTIGMLANSLPVVTRWHDDPPFLVALDQVVSTTIDCLANRRLAFDDLIAQLQPRRATDRSPIFQVMFSLQQAPARVDQTCFGAGLRVTQLPVPVRTAKFEMSLDVTVEESGMRCDFEWSKRRFNEHIAGLFLDHFGIAASYAARQPEGRVGEWPLAERAPRTNLSTSATC